MTPRILLVDDHPVFRAGLRQLLARDLAGAEFGEAGNAREAMAVVGEQPWDVTILDIDMPGRSGLDLLTDLRALRPEMPVLLLSFHDEEEFAVRALRRGAAGYVCKEDPMAEVLSAVRKVLAGGNYISARVAEQLARGLGRYYNGPPHLELSNREFDVLRQLAAGKRLGEIATDFCVSIKTVSTYRMRLLEKLGLQTNADLVRYAIEHHLLS
jgi:two-component system, NarL family, invasion response regulator UvrY